MRQLSAVRTSPSWLMVMGREVGTVTFMAVPAGSPPELPSVVELRLTGVVPEPGADGKGKDEAEGEDEGSGLFELFHVGISPFE